MAIGAAPPRNNRCEADMEPNPTPSFPVLVRRFAESIALTALLFRNPVTAWRGQNAPRLAEPSALGYNITMKKIFINRILKLLCIIAAAIFVFVAVEFPLSNYCIKTVRYEFESELINEPVTIVQLSDLHGEQFGQSNDRLVRLVSEQEPDLILMTGDMVSSSDANGMIAAELIERLVSIAPVYYAMGNHECANPVLGGSGFYERITAAGAVLLDCSCIDITVNGNSLRIGGLLDCYVYMSKLFLDYFSDTDAYKILISHQPEEAIPWARPLANANLMLCGHTHGGQICLPFETAIYAPGQGLFFPKYAGGSFRFDGTDVVISRGLGCSGIPFRFCCPPELVVITLS